MSSIYLDCPQVWVSARSSLLVHLPGRCLPSFRHHRWFPHGGPVPLEVGVLPMCSHWPTVCHLLFPLSSYVSSLRPGTGFVLLSFVARMDVILLDSWQKFHASLLNKYVFPHYSRCGIDCVLIVYLHIQDRIDTYTGDLHFGFC